MKVVHIQTVIITNFGLIDDDGDVIELRQAQTQLKKLTAEEMERALAELITARKSLATQPVQE